MNRINNVHIQSLFIMLAVLSLFIMLAVFRS